MFLEPLIFVGIGFEDRFLFNLVLAEDAADVFLFLGFDAVFLALHAVIVCLAEVGDDFPAHGHGFLVRDVVEESLSTPGDAHPGKRHEVRALSLSGDVAWIDDFHLTHFRRNVFRGEMAQAGGRTRATVVEAMGKGAGHAAVVEGGGVVHGCLSFSENG